jgi:tetratricopeptide (TPR) repeat protein
MIPELAETPELRTRFLREAQAAGGLRHRNIVTVYDLGEDKGRPYIAMEFIEGTDLEKVIQSREPYPVEWKLDVIGQICEGLSYAHRNGIVHRDVKPANIRVTPDDEVKIMDFGIAHLQSSNLTKSGLVLGTVHYMSPEQIDGGKVDHRADIFAVGAIAYELFSYRKPFDGESITGVMFKIMHERADFGALPPTDYSPGLERIITRALARDAAERYQSLDEMHDELTDLIRDAAPRVAARAQEQAASAGAAAAPPAATLSEVDTATLEGKVATEADMRRARVAQLIDEGRRALAGGALQRAKECAEQALDLFPDDAAVRALALDADSEALRRRVEQEKTEIRSEMDDARAAGHLHRALGLCRRLLDLDPEDGALRRTEAGIQASIYEKEVEQLSSQALAYAADGDFELASKIAGRIERIAPQSPVYAELRRYLDDEGRRHEADGLTAAAQEHLAQGELEEARAAAERALTVDPRHAVAREIRDRASSFLGQRASSSAVLREPPPVAVEQPAVMAEEAVVTAPEAAPEADAALAGETPSPSRPRRGPELPKGRLDAVLAQIVSASRTPVPRPAPAEVEGTGEGAGLEGRRSEAEALTTAALDHFVKNDYGKARKAVEKALALEPKNKKARELLKILGALG